MNRIFYLLFYVLLFPGLAGFVHAQDAEKQKTGPGISLGRSGPALPPLDSKAHKPDPLQDGALTERDALYYKILLETGYPADAVTKLIKTQHSTYRTIPINPSLLTFGPEQNCPDGIPVCQNSFTQPNSYSGFGYQEVYNTCLLAKEQCTVWYIFTIQPGGGTNFQFQINTIHDYDWAVYDLTAIGGCSKVPTSAPVSCNFSGTYGNTGINSGQPNSGSTSTPSTGVPFNPDLTVTIGHTYALVIDNYTQDANGYTLTFSGASIVDNTPPTLVSTTDDCSNSITLTTSEGVLCSTIAANGSDFIITGPAAMTVLGASGIGCSAPGSGTYTTATQIQLTLSQPATSGTYTVTVASGTDGNTLQDKCALNSMAAGSSLTFNYLAPLSISTSAASLCVGGTATLTSSGGPASGGTYSWNPSSGATSTLSVTPSITTTYYLTTTLGTCSRTASQVETIQAPPVVSITPMNAVLCSGTQALTASSTLNGANCASCTYNWTGGYTGSSNPTPAQGSGTYTVTATSSAGCVSSAVNTSISLASASTTCNVYYVKNAATGAGDGSSPTDASTIQTAVASAQCGAVIKMAVGIYNIVDRLQPNSYVTIEGGFNLAFTTKTSDMSGSSNSTTIRRSGAIDGDGGNKVSAFVFAANSVGFRLQDLRIEMPGNASATVAANASGAKTSNYAIYMASGCSSYTIVRCYIDAGAGSNGTNGVTGANGSNGVDNASKGYLCGDNTSGGAGAGIRKGGDGGQSSGIWSNDGVRGCSGGWGANGSAGGGGAAGGAGGVYTSGACACNTSGSGVGSPGSPGANGGGGTPATAATYGAYFLPGGNGGTGTDGGGGGGGGGGGSCSSWTGLPGTGGGSGGAGGTGGTAAGGAFGVFSVAQGGGGVITDCQITANAGTTGAASGTSSGGSGGAVWTCAAIAAADPGDLSNMSGKGGNGGTGGPGAAGAAGDFCLVCNITGGNTKNTITYTFFSLTGEPIIVAGDPTNNYTSCTNKAMNMTAPAGTHNWSGAPLSGSASPQTVTYTTTGRKTVTMSNGTSYNYTDFNNMITTAPSAGTILLAGNPVCPGVTTVTSSVAGTPGFTYSWTITPAPPAGVTAVCSSPTASSTVITITNTNASPQTFTVQLIVTSSCCGALGAITQNITVSQSPSIPVAAASASPVCPGTGSTLSVTSSTANLSFNWYAASSGGSALASGPTYTVYPTTTTAYYVDATNTNGCVSSGRATVTVVVTDATPPVCPSVTVCGPQNVTLTISSPVAGATYNWYNTGCLTGQQQTGFSPSFTTYASLSTTIYVTVTLPGCNESGCTAVTITVNSAAASITWTGATSTDWFDANNWGGCLPSCGTDVLIPSGTPHNPAIGFSGLSPNEIANCHTITLNNTASLTFSDSKAQLYVCGDFNHYGVLTMPSMGSVIFVGTSPQNYSRSSTGTGAFYNLVLNNTAASPSLTILDGAGYQDMNVATDGTFSFISGMIITKNTRTLNIKNTSPTSLAGYGTSMYVWGNLARSLAVNGYDFPVGNGNAYQLMNINFTVLSTLTSVTVSFDNPSNATGTGLPLTEASGTYSLILDNGGVNATTGYAGSLGGVWTVLPNVAVTTSVKYDMTLYGRNYDNAGGGFLSIIKRNTFCPGTWALDGTYITSSNSGNVVSAYRTGFTGFSQFAISPWIAPLPIELAVFEASCIHNKAQVNWVSATETNNAYYTVERSCGGGADFDSIAVINGAGNSSGPRQYNFTDTHYSGGTCYYRLRQTDFNGASTRSKVISLNCQEDLSLEIISIFPNPSSDKMNVFYNSPQSGTVRISLTDAIGKELFTSDIPCEPGLNKTSLDLNEYSNGIYFIRISNGSKFVVRKVAKQ